jgi:predicted transcriptional regulator
MLNGEQKSGSCMAYLPFSIQQLKEHLESKFDEKMNWDNYGSYWDVDHIYPQSLLQYDNMQHENFLKTWSLDNLQPLSKIENIKKSNKLME